MKKFLMNISAALLVVWYCMSIIGFDVHTCMSSGRTFIVTFAEGMACADVHPESHCCSSSCCSDSHDGAHAVLPRCSCSSHHHEDQEAGHHESSTVDSQSCCSDEYQVILLSGCRMDNDSEDKFSLNRELCPCMSGIPVSYLASASYHAGYIQYPEPDSGVIMPGDICVAFGVLRI